MSDSDWLGGFTLEELLGATPIAKPEPKKPSLLGRIIGAPFKLVFGLLKLPVTAVQRVLATALKGVRAVLLAPLRVLKVLLPPWTSKKK